MKRKKIDNFSKWRDAMKEIGKIPKDYPSFLPSNELAEYIGVILGDGHIEQFPRTERIYISCNSNHHQFIQRYAELTKKLFHKEPKLLKAWDTNSIRISLYQKEISSRLKIPHGNRKDYNLKVPQWIFQNKIYLAHFLRGLFEAEGSLSIHHKTCTYNFSFSNLNPSLLRVVEKGLRKLGFHPEVRYNAIRLRRKKEIESCIAIIQFRCYSCGVC